MPAPKSLSILLQARCEFGGERQPGSAALTFSAHGVPHAGGSVLTQEGCEVQIYYEDSVGRRRIKRRYAWAGWAFAVGFLCGLAVSAAFGH